MPCPPGLQGGARNLKLFSSLTLGDALSLQLEIVLQQVSPLATVPALMTVGLVILCKINYRAHSYLSLKPLLKDESSWLRMAR